MRVLIEIAIGTSIQVDMVGFVLRLNTTIASSEEYRLMCSF